MILWKLPVLIYQLPKNDLFPLSLAALIIIIELFSEWNVLFVVLLMLLFAACTPVNTVIYSIQLNK